MRCPQYWLSKAVAGKMVTITYHLQFSSPYRSGIDSLGTLKLGRLEFRRLIGVLDLLILVLVAMFVRFGGAPPAPQSLGALLFSQTSPPSVEKSVA